MLLFMHITLVNAKDRYERVWRGVLATSFQDIVSEEKELLFLRHGRPEMLANQMLSFAFYAGGKEKEGLHTLKKFSHPPSRFKEQSPFRFAGAQNGIQSHPF